MAGYGAASALTDAGDGNLAGAELERLSGHVVILNCSAQVPLLAESLWRARGESLAVVLVVQDLALWRAHPEWHPVLEAGQRFAVVVGRPTDAACLERAGISRARAAIILADPEQGELADARSTLIAVAIEQRNPQVHTVIELLSSINRSHLSATAVDDVVCVGDIGEKLIAQTCVTPGVGRLFEQLLGVARGGPRIHVARLPPALAGASFRELSRRAISAAAPFVLIGFLSSAAAGDGVAGDDRGGEHAVWRTARRRSVVLNPRPRVEPGRETPLGEDDLLVAIADEPPQLERWLQP
ncbi:MAG: NAD-binding protein [Deltaproteobacteria bacterium]|nr:NAD-binding protein [Deltaproteobacteria bacterium]